MRGLTRLVTFVFGLILTVACAFSQSTALRGVITDPQGGAIPEALIALTNTDTGLTRQTLSTGSGEYQFVQLAPGTYKLVATKAGFSINTKTEIKLLVNTPATLDVRMDFGKTETVVNVEAETSAINTVDASVGNAFSETQVRQPPLETRNVVQLLSLQPSVTTNGEVLGARRDQNNITLDGVDGTTIRTPAWRPRTRPPATATRE